MDRRYFGFLLLLVVVLLLVGLLLPSLSSCVVEGSLIATPDGPKRIERLRVGDSIYCQSPTGALVVGKVLQQWTACSNQYMEFELAGREETLRVTGSHPVGTDGTWREAKEIEVGDMVSTTTGSRRVEAIRDRAERVRVYDLAVEPFPNFFANGVLVHNKSRYIPFNRADLCGVWVGISHYGMNVYRIELDEDGTGTCAFHWGGRYGYHEAVVHKITDWQVDVREIKITIKPSADYSSPTFIKGRAWDKHTMNVDAGGTGGLFAHDMSLIREDELLSGITNTRDAMTNAFGQAEAE